MELFNQTGLIVFMAALLIIGLSAATVFTIDSFLEKEPRAPWFGIAGIILHLALGTLLFSLPAARPFVAGFLVFAISITIFFMLPLKAGWKPKSAADFLVNDGADYERFDERDTVFSRNHLQPDQPEYKKYYTEMHPEHKQRDDKRRKNGGPVGRPGRIDGFYMPNVAMMYSVHEFGQVVGDRICLDTNKDVMKGSVLINSLGKNLPKTEVDAEKITHIAKNWALHVGAGLVGVTKVDKRWLYTHMGRIFYDNWEDWGKEFDHLPYAIVFVTEMSYGMLASAPHLPGVIESGYGYAKDAFIGTVLARFIAALGYRAHASMNRNYEVNLVPLAIDAGLGELGRLGYLITDKYGSRNRIGAVLTDMPLVPDSPIDLGAEVFCQACRKCGESCPSRSIPLEKEQTVKRGMKKWHMDAESCFDYWGRIGTDCGICMAVCPYGRPNKRLHKFVRFMLKQNYYARLLFPYIDNLLYGKYWKRRKPLDWVKWPKPGKDKWYRHTDADQESELPDFANAQQDTQPSSESSNNVRV